MFCSSSRNTEQHYQVSEFFPDISCYFCRMCWAKQLIFGENFDTRVPDHRSQTDHLRAGKMMS